MTTAGNPDPRGAEHGEVPIEDFIGDVQYAIRGAATIYAERMGITNRFTLAAGQDHDSMLDQVADLLFYAAEIATTVEWTDFLQRICSRVVKLTDLERRAHFHNALTGLRSGKVQEMVVASDGALEPLVDRNHGNCWMMFDPTRQQHWRVDSGDTVQAQEQPAPDQRQHAPDWAEPMRIAGNSLHWWDDNRPPVR